MIDPKRSEGVLDDLRALGVRIAVDDYGTGYSSLAYLQRLAVDELKLDKSFVLPVLEEQGAAAIVRTTIDLAHSLGLRLVAEGVETEAHLHELAGLGCDLAQGYHISRPLPAQDLPPGCNSGPASRSASGPQPRTGSPPRSTGRAEDHRADGARLSYEPPTASGGSSRLGRGMSTGAGVRGRSVEARSPRRPTAASTIIASP
jgi:EAL domain